MTYESRLPVVFADVYEDLKSAYFGKNGYGGDTAEIYAFRLVEHRKSPTTNPDEVRDWTDADSQLAADNLYQLFRDFLTEFPDATFLVPDPLTGLLDEVPVGGALTKIWPFSHRVHVTVRPREVDDPKMAIYLTWKPETGDLRTYRLTVDGGILRVEQDTGRDALGARYWTKAPSETTSGRVLAFALRALAHGEYEHEFRDGVEHYRIIGTFEEEI